MPGDESSESELLTGEQLESDASITLRTAFSHPELISPIQILQAVSASQQLGIGSDIAFVSCTQRILDSAKH